MKDRIMNSRFIRWITGWKICRFFAGNKLLSKFCNYEMISYIIVGVLTTVVNYVTYFVLRSMDADPLLSNSAAWVLSVLFAFFANKIFVFLSPSWVPGVLFKELFSFIACRLLSFVFDMAFIQVTVVWLCWNEPVAKILDNVFVLLANYFASKFFIFKKPQNTDENNTITENKEA